MVKPKDKYEQKVINVVSVTARGIQDDNKYEQTHKYADFGTVRLTNKDFSLARGQHVSTDVFLAEVRLVCSDASSQAAAH